MGRDYKRERGHVYGDFEVIEYTEQRVSYNGCVKWKCSCINCGSIFYIGGDQLRAGRIRNCQVCKSNKSKGDRKRVY